MSTKKNIDRLFQEKFKDFEATPSEAVWEKIKARQNSHKRGILIPFWYKIGGVAAVFAMIFTIGYVSITTKPNKTIVLHDDVSPSEIVSPEKIIDTIANHTTIVSSDQNDKNDYSDIKTYTSKKDSTINTSKNVKVTSSQKNLQESITRLNNKKTMIAEGSLKKGNLSNNQNSKKKEKANIGKTKQENSAIVDNQNSKSEKVNSPFILLNQKDKDSTERIAQNKTDINTNTEKDIDSNIEEDKHIDNPNKKSIFDAIKNEEEAVVEESEASKKWNIMPNIAPVYYDASGNGSSLGSRFSDNPKSGQINLSYGIQVAYKINKKLSIRSGVNKLDLSYNTKGVGFEVPSAIRSSGDANSDTTIQNVIVSDYRGQSSTFSNTDINNESLIRGQNPGLLNHSLGYIEVPIEVKYTFIETKFGVHIIGGISTLFLDQDDVSIVSGDYETNRIEREFNVNEMSYSGNIGFGVNYELSQQLQFNLEPILKYQFNGFKNSSKNFTPYSFGIYTGMSIKF